jgi:hypothetical protein
MALRAFTLTDVRLWTLRTQKVVHGPPNAGHNLRTGRARALHVPVRVRGGKEAQQGA